MRLFSLLSVFVFSFCLVAWAATPEQADEASGQLSQANEDFQCLVETFRQEILDAGCHESDANLATQTCLGWSKTRRFLFAFHVAAAEARWYLDAAAIDNYYAQLEEDYNAYDFEACSS